MTHFPTTPEPEIEALRRELERSREETRTHRRRAARFGRDLMIAKDRLETLEGRPEVKLGTFLRRPADRWQKVKERRDLERIPRPNMLIVGAQKAGTRWLRYNLGLHPDIFAAPVELNYFDSGRFARGLDWYRLQYSDWSGERVLGEATPGYMFWRKNPARNARRIGEQLPDVRLFAVLRDPCDRALSALNHQIRRKRVDPNLDLVEYVKAHDPETERFQLVAGGWYAASLQPFVERFGDRLKVLLTEDVRSDAHAVYRSALEHLEVDPGFAPKGLEEVRFSNAPRAEGEEGRGGTRRRSLTSEERARLYPYFAEDIDRLEPMIERDLSHWRPQGVDLSARPEAAPTRP